MSEGKWMIVGARGALGTDLMDVFGDAGVAACRDDFDLTDKESMYHFIRRQPVVGLINTAAYHNVPLCEDHEMEAFDVNARGVKNMAEICSYLKLHLCHISTDYVFDGKEEAPYIEEDLPSPLNTYAVTKLAGEHMVQAYASSWSIVRTCGLYGKIPTRAKKGNFITQIIKQAQEGKDLKVVNDEFVTPTWTRHLAEALKILVDGRHQGLFHINQNEFTSWYDFAKVILEVLGFSNDIQPVSRESFASNLKRPAYSVLNIEKFENATRHKMANWDEALRTFLLENRETLLRDPNNGSRS